MTSTFLFAERTDGQAHEGLALDREAREVWLDGHLVDLTRSEFDLLAMLMDAPRHVLSPDQLLAGLWHSSHVPDSGAIETYISRVRRKIGEFSRSPRFIHTVRGVGYKYLPQARSQVRRRVAFYDIDGTLKSVEPDSEPLLGWDLDEIIGTRFFPMRNPVWGLPAIVVLINRVAELGGLQSFSISHFVQDKLGVLWSFDATCRFVFDGERLSHLEVEFVIRD